ncbi:MAG: FMN-binding negative transcriptional regulator [Burkholderiaceae bacterium]
MYQPSHFVETRLEELHRILRDYPLGMLVTHGPHGLDANHLPFELEAGEGPSGLLRAHVARANPLLSQVPEGAEVMVVFRGAHGYISPNWYPSKHETHRHVPTWNYEVVHVHGPLRILDDEKFLRGVVGRLTRHHESTEPRPWKMGDAPRDYMDQMIRSIVGIEIPIMRIEGKRKLGQNRETRDREGAAQSLRDKGNLPLSEAMANPGQLKGL